MKRLQIVVLIADDTSPELRATIEASIKKAVDRLFVEYGGELHIGDLDAGTPRGRNVQTISYAGHPRRKRS